MRPIRHGNCMPIGLFTPLGTVCMPQCGQNYVILLIVRVCLCFADPPSPMTRTLLDGHDGNVSVKESQARTAVSVARSHSFGGMSVRSQVSGLAKPCCVHADAWSV